MSENTRYPALTVGGETVTIVEKRIEGSADRPMKSTILVDEDGNEYRPSANGLRLVPVDSEMSTGSAEADAEVPGSEDDDDDDVNSAA